MHIINALFASLLAFPLFGAIAAESGTAAPADGLSIAVAPALSTRQRAVEELRSHPWQDAMLAGVRAIEQSTSRDTIQPFISPILRGGDPMQRVVVDVSDASELYLFVTGIPDVKWAVADWAEARLVTKNGEITHLNPAGNAKVILGRCEKDLTLRSGLYQKMRLGRTQFDHGLNVQANSVIRVALDGRFAKFEAWIGVDAWAGTNGSVQFAVLGSRAAARQQLYAQIESEFTDGAARQEMRWERQDGIFMRDWDGRDYRQLSERYAAACSRIPPLARLAGDAASRASTESDLRTIRGHYFQSRRLDAALQCARDLDTQAAHDAVADLIKTFPNYPRKYASDLRKAEQRIVIALNKISARSNLADYEEVGEAVARFQADREDALLANPLLDFGRLLLIKRKPTGDARRSDWEGFGYGEYLGIPRQSSWNYGTMPNVNKWTNEIATLSPLRPGGSLQSFYRPTGNRLVNDIDLHWNSDKLLFSMPDTNRNWQVCEIHTDGSGFRQLTPSVHRDIHNYNGIYLPSGEIVFLSTAPLQGVPCNSGVIVGMAYKMGANGDHIRQLTFEQDHDYTPSILNDGRILYLRWDYTDTPHIWNRVLMSMNPDGTGQGEFYGGNSYWPNAIFFARAIPNDASRIVGIVTGHHEGRVGELFIFDPAKGRHEISGVVQRIPRRGPRVEAKIEDKLTEHSWPKFLHPWPLNDKYFLVACKPDPDALWGIYLVDVFDNMTLLKEEEGYALLDPVPVMRRPMPPVIQDRTDPARKDALVYIEDVYQGPGLRGVPRGTVKSLRVFTYHFAYQRLAGIDHRVGADGPWEAKRVLGTVPVEKDGSALFKVPAKTPLSLQPLDAEGKAVALMRSWLTAMPGEKVSCIGCHEQVSTVPSSSEHRLALGRQPAEIKPWRGEARPFSFAAEVQPVLDRFCVGCHDAPESKSVRHALPDLRRNQGGFVVYQAGKLDGRFVRDAQKQDLLGKYGAVFDPSYVALRQFVRVGGLESDLHHLLPREFHADTSELVQMLAKGHHNVKLDAEAWDRLVTWIDLNAPCHGTWSEVTKIPGDQCKRRQELRALYGGVEEDYEHSMPAEPARLDPVLPMAELSHERKQPTLRDWPLSPAAARAQQSQMTVGPVQHEVATPQRTVELGDGVRMQFVKIPAGEFVMGDADGAADERDLAVVRIDRPFWMSKYEVSNREYQKFKPDHDSRFEHRSSWIFSEEYLGWPLNKPNQPVVRVSWNDATRFCHWLGEKLREEVALPTEAQWEYACRAGTGSPMSYGGLDDDFSRFANMGDVNLRRLADEGWRPKAPDLVPRDARFNDGALVTCDVGSYQPNAWGLYDMHGNAAEWTRTTYAPYPYKDNDGRNRLLGERKVVRGGSWRDRPKNCRSGFRWAYSPWQAVYNVGFRVIIEIDERKVAQRQSSR